MEKSKLLRIALITYFVALLIAHIIPASEKIALDEYILGIRKDHWVHASIFLPLGLLFGLVKRLEKLLILGLICISYECLHYFIPYRSFDIHDIYANLTGCSIGILIAWSILRFKPELID